MSPHKGSEPWPRRDRSGPKKNDRNRTPLLAYTKRRQKGRYRTPRHPEASHAAQENEVYGAIEKPASLITAVAAANVVPATITVPSKYAPAFVRFVPSRARSIDAGTSATNGSAISFHLQTQAICQRSTSLETKSGCGASVCSQARQDHEVRQARVVPQRDAERLCEHR